MDSKKNLKEKTQVKWRKKNKIILQWEHQNIEINVIDYRKFCCRHYWDNISTLINWQKYVLKIKKNEK